MEKTQQISFADLAFSKRKIKEDFFNQINLIIDWNLIDRIIRKYYQKGESAVGRPCYEGIVLFKMSLLQTWYGLSDYELEDQVNDRISFSRFVGIGMDGTVPDHSVVSRFRTELTQKRAYDKLLISINEQLEKKAIIVKKGVLVDASVTDSPRKPKGKKEYEVVEDCKEENDQIKEKQILLKEKIKPGVDTQAKWIKKSGKLHYGYKQHTATNQEGLVLGLVTTSANESDITHLEDVLELIDLPKRTWVKADKGYKSAGNDEILRRKKLKNHIMRKAPKGKKLTEREMKCNKLVSKIRFKVERTFGSIHRWFGGGIARYVGLEKMHTQHLMEAIAYNLYRSPRITVFNFEI
jgi:transposase, IS5 family